MNRKLIIIGASGHGKVVSDIAKKINKWQTIEFLDDDESLETTCGLKVIGKTLEAYTKRENVDYFVAIGNNNVRKKIQKKLEKHHSHLISLVHPSAVIGSDVEIGEGTVVMAGVVINCSTYIGKGCIINTSSSVDHDNIIHDFVHISPNVCLAGTVRVGQGNWIGAGTVVSNNVKLCSGCQIGAGSLVIKDINEPGIYVGSPVKKIK